MLVFLLLCSFIPGDVIGLAAHGPSLAQEGGGVVAWGWVGDIYNEDQLHDIQSLEVNGTHLWEPWGEIGCQKNNSASQRRSPQMMG